MATVAQLLQAKGRDVWSISPDASVYDAISMMAQRGVGALLVIEGEQLVGILSERDYARKVILEGRSSKDTPVRAIMTAKVLYVRPEQTVEECMSLMTEKHIRHLPVLVDGRLHGIVSIGDLVNALLTEQGTRIEQLENYITGTR